MASSNSPAGLTHEPKLQLLASPLAHIWWANRQMNKQFKSRKSILLTMIVWGPLIGLCVLTYRPIFSDGRILETLIHTSIWTITFLVISTVWFGIKYIITDKQLIIKIGPITERKIDICEIISTERSYSLLASPSTALRRLKITYDHYNVLISPKKESEFLKLIKQINPDVQVYNLENTSKIW